MKNKCLSIIARYNEDLNWISNLNHDLLIYNKGSDFPFKFPKTDIENIGRETETFIRSIVENYKYLKDYNYLIFLQGNPFEHCPRLFEKIKLLSDTYIPLTKSESMHTTNFHDDNIYLFDKSLAVFEKLFDAKSLNMKFTMVDHEYNIEYDATSEVEELMYLADFLGIDYKNKDIKWATGAQYKVPVNLILNKSFAWWNDLLKLIWFSYSNGSSNNLAYVFERIWPLIWTHSDKNSKEC